MANPWFRMYSEIIYNPKVQVLTEALRWRYVALLCLHCNGQYENAPIDEIALALRIDEDEWLVTRDIFIKRRLLDENGRIAKWENRQYISDLKDPTAAERQKRYRDNKRNQRNAAVTSRPPESDTDTDTEYKNISDADASSSAKRVPAKSRFDDFYAAYPKKRNRGDAEKAWKRLKPDDVMADRIVAALKRAVSCPDWVKEGGQFIPYPASWLNAKGWEDDLVVELHPEVKPKAYRMNHLGVVEEHTEYGGIPGWSLTQFRSLSEYEAANGIVR